MAQPEIGELAPDFTLPTDTIGDFTLSDHRGRPVVIFFYSTDDTESCTNENLAFAELQAEFDALNALVVGISPNSVAEHAKFRAKYGLSSVLVADPDHKAIDAFGVWGPKKFMGRDVVALIRTTFLIDAEGRIADIWKVLRVKPHPAIVLERVKQLTT